MAALPFPATQASAAGTEGAEPGLAGRPQAVVVDDSCPGLLSLAEFTEELSSMERSRLTIYHRWMETQRRIVDKEDGLVY
jgi:hypothetical protein